MYDPYAADLYCLIVSLTSLPCWGGFTANANPLSILLQRHATIS